MSEPGELFDDAWLQELARLRVDRNARERAMVGYTPLWRAFLRESKAVFSEWTGCWRIKERGRYVEATAYWYFVWLIERISERHFVTRTAAHRLWGQVKTKYGYGGVRSPVEFHYLECFADWREHSGPIRLPGESCSYCLQPMTPQPSTVLNDSLELPPSVPCNRIECALFRCWLLEGGELRVLARKHGVTVGRWKHFGVRSWGDDTIAYLPVYLDFWARLLQRAKNNLALRRELKEIEDNYSKECE